MNKPVPCSRRVLLNLLDDIREHVRIGDSFEGSLEYSMPFDEEGNLIEDADFVLRAAYRIGNLQGQGGMRMIGTLTSSTDPPDQEEDQQDDHDDDQDGEEGAHGTAVPTSDQEP